MMKSLLVILLVISISQSYELPHPVRLGYVNTLNSWWPAETILAEMEVPGYATGSLYNYIVLGFWSCDITFDMVTLWEKPQIFMGGDLFKGYTDAEVRQFMKKKYNEGGVKIMVSAFGGTSHPTSQGKNPTTCAKSLAQFVKTHDLDGVDIDYEDNDAMNRGQGANWVITFSKQLRLGLPNHIITHAPQGPYFKDSYYRGQSYIKVDRQVGQLIDFYNVQFYNQGNTQYDTYDQLFIKASGFFSGTAVSEMIANGINKQKIIVGKPATVADAMNTGWVNSVQLGQWTLKACRQLGWDAGVMFWQIKNDAKGVILKNSIQSLLEEIGGSGSTDILDHSTNIINKTTDIINKTTDVVVNKTTDVVNKTTDVVVNKTTDVVNKTTDAIVIDDSTTIVDNVVQDHTQIDVANHQLQTSLYPIRMTHVQNIARWWPVSSFLADLCAPKKAPTNLYNIISYNVWTYSYGAVDSAIAWSNIGYYITYDTDLGKNNSQIHKNIVDAFHKDGKKVIVTAFGTPELPTSMGYNATQVAESLSKFIIDNNFDGVDIQYKDTAAFMKGTAEEWLIELTKVLRSHLPTHIISHSVSNFYFKPNYFVNGGYAKVHARVGNTISFYSVEYLDELNTYQQIFIDSDGTPDPGTSIKEIHESAGVPYKKLVVGKPVESKLKGFVKAQTLSGFAVKAHNQLGWNGGISLEHFQADRDGVFIKASAQALVNAQ